MTPSIAEGLRLVRAVNRARRWRYIFRWSSHAERWTPVDTVAVRQAERELREYDREAYRCQLRRQGEPKMSRLTSRLSRDM